MQVFSSKISKQNSSSYDVIVVGASPSGIAAAIRAAREKLSVLLIESSGHVGGMWTSGLQGFDTRYSGHRSPVLSEFLERIQLHYIETFGKDSPEHILSTFRDPSIHGNRPRFEARVAESVFKKMIAEQAGLTLMSKYRLHDINKEKGLIRSLQFKKLDYAQEKFIVYGDIFVDATYTADLAALSSVPYHVGREGKEEFGENHAGRHFTKIEPRGEWGYQKSKELNLHYFNRTARKVFSGSTGESDQAVQAYCVRLTLTDVEENMRRILKPKTYDRERFKGIVDCSSTAYQKEYPLGSHFLSYDFDNDNQQIFDIELKRTLQNGKTDWFGANFVGHNHEYPNAGPIKRKKIYRNHVDHALGMIYFLQNDPAVPFKIRENFRQWGLPKDEYTDSGNIPWMMYVREARRIRGKYIFSENDATRHPEHGRTPIHPDSIAFAEWPMDSHDCNPVRVPGSGNDGEFILADETFPSQIPYRCIISDQVENLLLPLCMSATHVGWGTLRLEPVFVHTGEAAGVSASVCIRDNILPNKLDGKLLQKELLKRKIAVSYFSDIELGSEDNSNEAIQYLGARGFFGQYASHPDNVLEERDADRWRAVLNQWIDPSINADPDACAALVSSPQNKHVTGHERNYYSILKNIFEKEGWDDRQPVKIRDAAKQMYSILQKYENNDK